MTKLLTILICCTIGATAALQAPKLPNLSDFIERIETVKLHDGRNGTPTWFLPRVTMVPQKRGTLALMTLQTIAGSDYYGPVHWRESRDNGQTWSAPQAVPGLGREPYKDAPQGQIESAVSDVNLTYHAKTNTTIGIGEIVYYRGGKYFPEQPPRYPVYVVRDANGKWSERRKLEWDDPRASAIFAAGSAQTLVLANGDVIVPVSFRSPERTDYSVTTLQYGFDGKTMKLKRIGSTLENTVKRGLLEPQLTQFNGRFLLTIRAEDNAGYVSTSTDGLQWTPPQKWQWQDGEALEMSTTQQHWLTRANSLWLAYTRKDDFNANVMRWRAPLYLAQVDPATLRLKSSTERIVFPLIGDGLNDPTNVAHYGNFHVTAVNENESWVLAGEVIPANFRGDLLFARIHWRQANATTPRVLLQTELGDIELELNAKQAPLTVENFLRYLDAGHYEGGYFHRTVKRNPDNQPNNAIKIEVIQGGINPAKAKEGFAEIKLERTSVTGLKHLDGVISMARSAANSATSDFFICVGDQPELDFGGKRNADGQGFAAFGKVIKGMDVVRKIQQAAAVEQRLTPPVKIIKAKRLN